jgi:hypothetical protein
MPQPTTEFASNGDHRLATATVHHLLFDQVLEQCHEHLSSPGDLAFLLVVGASGSGKSHLLKVLYRQLLDQYATEMEQDPDIIPVLMLDTPAPPDGTFRWRALGAKLFEAARIPAGGRPSQPAFLGPDLAVARARTYGMTVDEVLRQAVQACRDRGVRIIILDEAGHLANVAYSLRPRQQLDVLKGLASEAGVRFLLAGTYDLLAFRDASAQLGRRSRLAHIAPYRADIKRERETFAAIATEMIRLIGVELHEDHDWSQTFLDGSLGCVGLLRDWLVDTENAYRGRAGRASFEDCLAEFRRSRGQLKKISAELDKGMARLEADRTGEPVTAKPLRSARSKTLNDQVLKPGEALPKRNHVPAGA